MTDPRARDCLTCGTPLPLLARPTQRYCDEECGEAYRARGMGSTNGDPQAAARVEAEIASEALLKRILVYHVKRGTFPGNIPYVRFCEMAREHGVVM